jgi:hypothetical protein
MRWSAQQHQHKTPHQSPLVTASPQGEALGAATPESVNNNLPQEQKRACCKTEVLQQATFYALEQWWSESLCITYYTNCFFGIAKLALSALTVWLWKTF